jgi:hypothetical protein
VILIEHSNEHDANQPLTENTMSIEAALAELTAAINRNSDLLETITTTAAKNVAKGADAPADKAPVKAPVTTKAPADKGPAKAPAKVKIPTAPEMAKGTTDFLEVEDEDEYAKRRALIKAIVTKHEVKKMSEIAEGDRQTALDAIAAYKAGDATGYEEEESMA